MPNLPQRKVGIVACSGEELPGGTLTRLAALKVLGELRPGQTVTICLPLFLAGGEGDRAFAKFYPTVAVDGCEKRCAARATELYSNKPAASIVVERLLDERDIAMPKSCRRFSKDDWAAVDAIAGVIAGEVDTLMAVRWSRTQGTVLEFAEAPKVSTSACACGSGIPVTTVEVDGQTVQLMALEPILEMAFAQGMRAGGPVPEQIMDTVRIYNQVPEGMESVYAAAVSLAWQDYCARIFLEVEQRGREASRG